MQSDKLQGEIASLNGKVQDLMTENLTFQERLKVINFLILPRLQFILFWFSELSPVDSSHSAYLGYLVVLRQPLWLHSLVPRGKQPFKMR